MNWLENIEVKKDSRIFIQIASYRDEQCFLTIESILENADHPELLDFSISLQRTPDENLDVIEKYGNDDRFTIIDVPIEKSHGACWARNLLQKFYKGQEYTLQLDSHMRASPAWDTRLKTMLHSLQDKGFPKPLITTYTASFDPFDDPNKRLFESWKLTFDRFTPEGVTFMLPAAMTPDEMKEPMRGRFYSAHFAFTLGDFVKEVPHDPEYYFHGEEIAIAVRSFTWGYDIFYPNCGTGGQDPSPLFWHEYLRKYRTKCWDDGQAWVKWNEFSLHKNRKLLNMDGENYDSVDWGPYGFGPIRTLDEYQRFSGLNFKLRGIQDYTKSHKVPPNPQYDNDEEYLQSFKRIYRHCIDVHFSSIPETDYEFWCVVFKDENDQDMYRQDATPQEIEMMKQKAENDKNTWINVWREFELPIDPKTGASITPSKWLIWPYSTSKGWCPTIEGPLFSWRRKHGRK